MALQECPHRFFCAFQRSLPEYQGVFFPREGMESHFGQATFFKSARFKLMTWLKNSLSPGKPHVLVLSGWRANRRRPASLCSTRTSRLVFTTSLSNCSRRILLHTSHMCAIFSPPSEAISTPCPVSESLVSRPLAQRLPFPLWPRTRLDLPV